MTEPTMPTFLGCRKALKEDLTELFSDMEFKNAAGEKVQGVTGYEQYLPEITADEEDVSQFFPYFIVRLAGGGIDHEEEKSDEDPWKVTVDVFLGIFDDSTDSQGSDDIINMIQRVMNRFVHEPTLAHVFRAKQDMSFQLQDEDTYPYYFGAVELNFDIPKIERRVVFQNEYT